MWDRCYIPDTSDIQTRSLKRANRCLPSTPRSSNIYIYLTQSMFHAALSRSFGSPLSCISSALTRPLKSSRTGTAPGDDISLRICKSDDSIIERRLDISPSTWNCFPLPSSNTRRLLSSHKSPPIISWSYRGVCLFRRRSFGSPAWYVRWSWFAVLEPAAHGDVSGHDSFRYRYNV